MMRFDLWIIIFLIFGVVPALLCATRTRRGTALAAGIILASGLAWAYSGNTAIPSLTSAATMGDSDQIVCAQTSTTTTALKCLASQLVTYMQTKVWPVASGGTGVTSAQGNGSKVQLSTGSTTTGHAVTYDANGNTVDSGAAPATGTVTSITPGACIASTNTGGTSAITSTGTLFGAANCYPSLLLGLALSNDGVSPNTVIDVAAGAATSDDSAAMMALAGAVTKNANSSWAVGTGNGCADGAAGYTTLGASTWYYTYLIERTDTGVVDVLCSLSASSPLLPTNYTKKRLFRAFKTDGSSHILGFTQVGNATYLATAVLDVNDLTVGTTATLETLASVPAGIKVQPLCRMGFSNAGTTSFLLTSPDETDVAPNAADPASAAPGWDIFYVNVAQGVTNGTCPFLTTNTSGQIRARAGASSSTLTIVTRGWVW